MKTPVFRDNDGQIHVTEGFEWPCDLRTALHRYWGDYYRALGCKDKIGREFEERDSAKHIARHEQALQREFTWPDRILVVGCGTGGECAVLYSVGCDVSGAEPEREANEIATKKMRLLGSKPCIFSDFAETLRWCSNHFSVILCHSVLEHVFDPQRALSEMMRVLKPSGVLILTLPDFASPIETHYKVPVPPKPFPRLAVELWLFLLRRNPTMIRNVHRLTSRNLKKLLNEMPGISHWWKASTPPYPKTTFPHWSAYITHVLDLLWRRFFGIAPVQEYYIFKEEENR